MVRGPEWSYMEELKQGKTTSHVRCKSCGHSFHGSATRIKEHLFSIGVNVEGCPMPPSDIHVKLNKYITKLQKKGLTQPRKKMAGAFGASTSNMHDDDAGNANEIPANAFDNASAGQCSRAPSSQAEQISLAAAFDKQSLLELHLK